MGKSKQNTRRKGDKCSSNEEYINSSVPLTRRGPDSGLEHVGCNFKVSDIISQTNSVLFEEDTDIFQSLILVRSSEDNTEFKTVDLEQNTEIKTVLCHMFQLRSQ